MTKGDIIGRGAFPLVDGACFTGRSMKAWGAAGGRGPDVVCGTNLIY